MPRQSISILLAVAAIAFTDGNSLHKMAAKGGGELAVAGKLADNLFDEFWTWRLLRSPEFR